MSGSNVTNMSVWSMHAFAAPLLMKKGVLNQPPKTCRTRLRHATPKPGLQIRAVLRERPRQTPTQSETLERQVWSAGERPPPIKGNFPPGTLPFAVEIDYVLNHPLADGIIALLVAINCFAFAMQTIDVGPLWHNAFKSYESNLSIVFLIEYFGRLYGKGFSPRFLLTRGMILDFLAVSPIAFAVADQSEALFVRLLRISRIFRIQRMKQMVMDSERGKVMMESMSSAQIRIANIGFSLFSLLYVSAGLFYQVEKDINPSVQNFFDAFYFTAITLFTVGFGDVTPLTGPGKTITVLTVLTGAVLIPYQLSEVERVRQITSGKSRSLTAYDDGLVQQKKSLAAMYDITVECKRCFLQGHQKDARFCRNCGALLSERLFD